MMTVNSMSEINYQMNHFFKVLCALSKFLSKIKLYWYSYLNYQEQILFFIDDFKMNFLIRQKVVIKEKVLHFSKQPRHAKMQ